jgi:hypothetical protein
MRIAKSIFPATCMLISLFLLSSRLSAEDKAPTPNEDASDTCKGMPLVFADDFEHGVKDWEPTDPDAWKVVAVEGDEVYNQFKMSDYQPPHRSPHNISLIKGVNVGDFVFKAKVLSTNPNAGAHRDMCIFFNYQDPAHFYYVHLGARPDPHSSQIMIVNDAPRKMITENESPGIPWTDDWHEVMIVRKVEEGTIEIYFDDMEKPKMVAHDKTFPWGRIGIGSFDDHGYWNDVKVYGNLVHPKEKAEATVAESE